MFLKKGFTLPLMIFGVVLLILTFIPAFTGKLPSSFKPEPKYECIAGYAFTFGGQQILNESGKGVPCNDEY